MISIRKAVVEDIALLADFQLSLALETENIALDKAIVMKGLKALFDDPSKGVYYVAEYNQKAAGCHLITFEWSEWRNGVVWWMQSVYVLAEYRKHKVFSAMYNNLIGMIQSDPSVIGLRLYVDKSNERAQQVYTAKGMNGEHYTVYEWMKA
jgi:ribosomal protein S18 acetylase RimI-like enzyme